jgi:hypothetical protein
MLLKKRIHGRDDYITQKSYKVDFLEKVAKTLYNNHRDEMEKQVIVLPSRRAGLYFARHLSGLSDKPQWAPQMVTVTELFASMTHLRKIETETLIFDLYKSYISSVTTPLPFDDFWAWGETIISDFNDIDLWLADAEKIYSNISDLKEIDQRFGGLTEEQIEIIRSFWVSFNPAETTSEARNAFRSVWQVLGPLYKSFKQELASGGTAWEGMLCRDVAEKAMSDTLIVPDESVYHIAGLNALNNCEKQLFLFLRRKGKARFYWDDDHLFMKQKDHKASVFINENIRLFGNDLPAVVETYSYDTQGRWTIIDTPSDSAQAKMLPEIIREAGIRDITDATDTAIILADEKLLAPVLTSLPEEISNVNVTMGHPFRFTPLYSFLKQVFMLARYATHSDNMLSFRAENVLSIVRHQYFSLLADKNREEVVSDIIVKNMLKVEQKYLYEKLPSIQLFNIPEDVLQYPAYIISLLTTLYENSYDTTREKGVMSTDREYMRLAIREAGKLRNLLIKHNLTLKIDTCIRLIDRIFKRLIVPFSGEPLRGLQVMGVLETRALEFKNVIFLSLNEGIFPNQSYENTFIPYNIRRAFGLPTINEHESIYSYHFFRLLRKPERGWFMYNSTAQGISSGEMSRYLIQMKYNKAFTPDFRTLHILVGRSNIIPGVLEKNGEHISLLIERYTGKGEKEKYMSPSAVNIWLNCRMRFYYRYVCRIAEEDKLEKEIDQRHFGNILHNVMMELYNPLKGEARVSSTLKALIEKNTMIRKTIIDMATREMKWTEENLMAGKGIIIIDVLNRYVKDILRYDNSLNELMILHLEEPFYNTFEIEAAGGKHEIKVGGIIDRVDSLAGKVRVVDYKTGLPKDGNTSLEKLFDESLEKRSDAVLQTLLYCNALLSGKTEQLIMPAIYWVQQISSNDFSPSANLSDFGGENPTLEKYQEVMKIYNEQLKFVLSGIFSPDEHFTMTTFTRRCTSCPYRLLCQR